MQVPYVTWHHVLYSAFGVIQTKYAEIGNGVVAISYQQAPNALAMIGTTRVVHVSAIHISQLLNKSYMM